MRDFLTGLAIILIVVLTTVLVAPYFVDWNGQRGFLEARLSTALGQKVTIGGNIDLRLLPTPYLTVDQVVVGGDDAALHVGVHRLDLELAVTPLLHGEFDIVEARLREPTVRVTLEHDRTLPALPSAPAFSAHMRFDRIEVTDGTLAVADPVTGRTFAFDHIDLHADAASLAGPFKIFGTEGELAHRTKFRLNTAAPDKGRTRAKLVIDETKDHTGIDLDGNLEFQDVGGSRIRQSFDGTLVLAGHVGQPGSESIGWRLAGPVKLDPGRAALEAGELRLGNDEAGLTLQAEAKVELGEQPKLAIALSAKQLDIDRLSGPPSDELKPPPKLPDLASLRSMLAAALPPVETGIDLSVETATYGGETLSGIEVHLGLGDAARQPLKLTIDGPGGAHVAVDGTLETNRAAFSGRVDVGADNLRRTADWLTRVAPAFAWSGGDLAFKTVRLAGRVDASASRVDVADLRLDLDRTSLGGTAQFAAGDGPRAAKLTLGLTAKALDLDGLPSVAALRGELRGLDLDARLDAQAVKVSRVGEGALDTGRIHLAFTKTGQELVLQTLRLDDLGGASVDGAGRLDAQGGQFAFTLDAGRLDAAAGLVRQLVPGAAADAFVARASALTPAKVKLDLALGGSSEQLVPKTLSVIGTANKTTIDAQIRPDGDATSLTASLQAPEGRILLRQLGLATISVETVGASRVTLNAHGRASEGFETVLSAAFGATTLDLTGRFKPAASAIGGTGRLTLRSADVSPLLQSLAIAFPDLTDRLPADMTSPIALDGGAVDLRALSGRIGGVGVHGGLRWQRASGEEPAIIGALDIDRMSLASLFSLALGHEQPSDGGVWSPKPFAAGLIDPPRTTLTLSTKSLALLSGLQGKTARMDVAIGPGLLSVSKFSTEVLDGTAEGGVLLRRDGRQATLEGRLTLNHVVLRVPGALDTRVTAHLDLAGSGTSAAGLVASLAGSGDATTTDLTVPAADPEALAKVFADVEDDSVAADPDATARAYDEAAKAPLTARSRHFGVTMAAGIAHLVPTTEALEPDAKVSTKIAAALDLGRMRVEEKVEETLKALPKNWTGPPPTMALTFEGPLGRPQRNVDMSGFSNALTARAVSRESARIEAGALDLRERALFTTRLKFEQRREDERRKVEDDARQAEDARKRRLEALRQDRARREQAKKDKEAKDKEAHDAAEKATREHPNDTPNRDRDAPPPQTPSNEPRPPAPGSDPSNYGRY